MTGVSFADITKIFGIDSADNSPVTCVCTDSREVVAGSLFVAITGENVDGHNYIEKAVNQGATAVLAQDKKDYGDLPVIMVEDTVLAMLKVGGWYREKSASKIVAITGSVGKTTTKDMVFAVLNSQLSAIKTQGNQNNEIGMPRTLLSMKNDTEVAVVEMGMCGFGEIAQLAQEARPNIGIITNIGVSHIEQLGSRENILKAKMELADFLADGSSLYLSGDDDLLCQVVKPNLNIIFYGIDNPNAHIKGEIISSVPSKTVFKVFYQDKEYEVAIPSAGKHLVQNALVAFGVGCEAGISPEKIITALWEYKPSGMRQNVVLKAGVTVVEDCYNASPDSVIAAVNTLKDFVIDGKKIAVLSDMLELGDIKEDSHYSCGRVVAENKIDCLVAIGELAQFYAAGAKDYGLENVVYFKDKADASKYLAENIQKGDVVWFKASRGMKLEDCIYSLYEHLESELF